jgi:hypothetical protein
MGVERVAMRALVGQEYEGRLVQQGETFDVSSDEVTELESCGAAIRLSREVVPKHVLDEIEMRRDRERYRRRDMRPKGGG